MLPREAIVEVPYEHLVAAPEVWLPWLYERIGARWTESDAANLNRVAVGPGSGRAREHELAHYGVSSGEAEAAFGDYPRLVDRLLAVR